MSGATHTALPWKFDDEPGCRCIKGGKSGDNRQSQYSEIAWTVGRSDDAKDRANAALIVRAVNCHAELVAALREIAEHSADYQRAQIDSVARAALAKAAP